MRDRQAEPGPLSVLGDEGPEDPLAVDRRDPRPGIRDRDRDRAVVRRERQRDRAPVRRPREGVGKEVGDDLEDAVSPDAKAEARAGAVAAVQAGGFGGREVVIRANGLDTPWGADDLAAVAEAAPDAVLVPKISTPEDLSAVRTALGPGLPIWAMIETCAAMFRLDALGAESMNVGVEAWVIGSNDLEIDGVTADGESVPILRGGDWLL